MANPNADLGLYLAISAAVNDTRQRECPWYAVWDICLNQYLFADSNTQTTACSTIPQYSLVWTYDVDVDDNSTPSSHSSSPADDHMQVSPPPQHLQLSKRSVKIPDFVQVLHRTIQPEEFPPCFGEQRVILIVEVKPGLKRYRFNFSGILHSQVAKQAMHAFAADPNLRSLGVILACGLYWAYYEVNRPFPHELEHFEKTMDDPDHVPQTENSTDTQSDNSGSSALSDPPSIIFHVPDCIDAIIGYDRFSFDDVSLCKQGLAQIAAHTRACHSQFWGLGDGECTTCTAVVCLLCHVCHLHTLTSIVPTGNREARALEKVARATRAGGATRACGKRAGATRACGKRAGANGQVKLLS
ncbi:hypothetical protein F4604DRAFT_1788753 [Suillus subluteus]|nr:hypothetical protein F4604DRAFT_1788753 [Suillus subluteus]